MFIKNIFFKKKKRILMVFEIQIHGYKHIRISILINFAQNNHLTWFNYNVFFLLHSYVHVEFKINRCRL